MAPRFEHYVIVDWSAANQPKTGRDSIWICHRGPHGERCENPATRHAAKMLLADILATVATSGERAILGFDFPFGYPAGFAARLGLAGVPWRAVWDEMTRLLCDAENNRNNRFEVGAALNRRVSNGARPFPFWGCPVGFADDFLGPRHHRGHGADEALQERRLIDTWMVGAQPCWKLAYTGSVGSQALTGIPVVRALRDDPRWSESARVWPFETGLGLPEDAKIVFAEVWPSWWRRDIRADLGPPNDKAQVRSVAEIFAERDIAGELTGWFAGDPNLCAEKRALVETEEAWTLGVTVPRRRFSPSPSMGEGRGGGDLSAWRPPGQRDAAASPPPNPPPSRGRAFGVGESSETARFDYLRDPAEIYRRSFALIRDEADLTRFPAAFRPLAIRLAHAAGDTAILADLAWSRGAFASGHRALAAGAAILVDGSMTAAGIIRERFPADNTVICTLRDPVVPSLAANLKTTKSAAALELWRPHLKGAIVAIGNAPTALFHLLEMLAAGADRPALVLGFAVGFVGAAEAKDALIAWADEHHLPYIALRGRRGGSALAAAALNALCTKRPG